MMWRVRTLPLLATMVVAVTAEAHPVVPIRQLPSTSASAADPHVAAIVYNPAALGLMRGLHVYVEGDVRVSTLSVKLDEGGRSSAAYVSPTGFVGIAYNALRDRITVAFATFTPMVDLARLPPSLERFATRYDFAAVQQNFAAGARISNRFTVGAAFTVLEAFGDVRFSRDIAPSGGSALVNMPNDLCGGAPCGYGNPAAKQQVRASAQRFGLGFTLGVLTRPIDRLWLGLSYQSRIFNTVTSSELMLSDRSGGYITPATGQGYQCGAKAEDACRGNVRIQMPIPNILMLSARIELKKSMELTLDFRWVNSGTFPTREIQIQGAAIDGLGNSTAAKIPPRFLFDRGLRDAFLGAVGLRLQPHRRVRVAPSLLYESPGVERSHTTPASLDGHKIDLSVVVNARLTQRVHLSAHAGFTTHAFGRIDSAFQSQYETDCVDAQYSLTVPACIDRVKGRAWPSASGTYVYIVPHFGLGLEAAF